MMTFTYRNRRLDIVAEAVKSLSALTEPLKTTPKKKLTKLAAADRFKLPQLRQTATLAALRKEQAELETDRYEVSDAFAAVVAAVWLWEKTAGLLDAAEKDMALTALKRKPELPAAAATAIQALPRDGAADAGFFARVAKEAGADAAAELAGIALGEWLRTDADKREYPLRDIAVMLPLRLETLFKKQQDGAWLLLLRVTPDEPSVLRDEPQVSPEEADYLGAFWRRSATTEIVEGMVPANWLEGDVGIAAWSELCDRVGAPRAAWLVAEFPPRDIDGHTVPAVPTERIGDSPAARVAGLPPELAVTAFGLDGMRFNIGTLSPAAGPIEIVMPTDPELPGNWLTDWKAAQEVGLGAEFPLPQGCGPDTIAALYVHGVGDEDAAGHFAAHAEAGVMGLLDPGAATNAVEGAAGADLGKDREAWRKVAANRMHGERQDGTAMVAEALCGAESSLPDLPGGAANTRDSQLLAQALWPALWGHLFHDIWACRDEAHDLWMWATRYLAPEGPLPPLRLDTQPYGLLPVTSLDLWERAGDEPADLAEERVVQALRQLLPQWAAVAEKRGTVTGSNEEGLLDLLGRTGVSGHYDYRTFLPAELLASLFYPSVPASKFVDSAFRPWEAAAKLVGHKPSKIYSAIWDAQPLDLPLIGARRMPTISLKELFEYVYDNDREGRFGNTFFGIDKRQILADSLIIRLMITSVVMAKAWYMQSFLAPDETLVNKTNWNDETELTPVEARQQPFKQAFDEGQGRKPVAELVKQHRERIRELVAMLDPYQGKAPDPYDPNQEVGTLDMPADRQAELERALRATLDTASHRLDPWATGIAWHRFRQQAASDRAHRRLGAYGWLDGPFLGDPGPNGSGRLHAPSYDQALTSIILRDKYLSAQNELAADGANIWQTELDSACVRTALDIAQEIRLGFHVYEVVGRRVEEVVGGRDQIALIRKTRPLRPERPDPRDVCQGVEALAELLGGGVAGVLSEDAQTRAEQTKRLSAIDAGLDAFADLMLAEGVYSIVGGQPERAADAMDAAAGFARPPDFDVVKTPRSGYLLTTNVISAMPYRAPLSQGTPLELADASLAGFLAERFGDPAQWIFRAQWKDGDQERAGTIDLAALGLSPLEAALIPHDFLAEVVRTRLGQPLARVEQADGHRLMRLAAGTFGAQPAMAADIAAVPDDSVDAPIDETVHEELAGRYAGIHKACGALAARASAAGNDDAGRVAVLRAALAWGVLGSPEAAARQALIDMLFQGVAADAEMLAALLAGVRTTLETRLAAAPDPADPATTALSAAALARAIGDLAAPSGKLTITARWSVSALRDRSGLRAAAEAALDTDWLPVIATVRPALARVEATQLEASVLEKFEPLTAWSSAPAGDPWRIDLVAGNKTKRDQDVSSMDMSRLVNAYGAADAFDGQDVAVSLIDQFSEAVPMAKRTTYAAFGFNAPASRAPQAILLAVPPKAERRLGPDELLQILIETRRLAHARAARGPDGPADPIAPSMWFQATGPLAMRLDTGTQYMR